MALSAFSGTSLRHLNIRETKVSGGVLYRILARNFDLKDLNIRGCTQLALNSFDHLPSEKTFERMWENVGIGWGLSDSTISSFGFASCTLQNFAVGVGGTISEETLLCIAEQCHELKRLSLCFQVGTHSTFSRPCKCFLFTHTKLTLLRHFSNCFILQRWLTF